MNIFLAGGAAMNTFWNRMKASLILTTGLCCLLAVFVILFGNPTILAPVGMGKAAALILMTGSFGMSLAVTNYLSFLEQYRTISGSQ